MIGVELKTFSFLGTSAKVLGTSTPIIVLKYNDWCGSAQNFVRSAQKIINEYDWCGSAQNFVRSAQNFSKTLSEVPKSIAACAAFAEVPKVDAGQMLVQPLYCRCSIDTDIDTGRRLRSRVNLQGTAKA